VKSVLLTTILSFIVLIPTSGVFSFTIKTVDDGTMLQWPPDRTTIFYMIGSYQEGPTPVAARDLARAFQVWEEKSQGELAFIYAGRLEDGEAVKDETNIILWVGDGWKYGSEIVAIATIWYSNEGGIIEEVDIEFNTRDFDWSSPGSPGILETALHEIGHLLGIGHSFNPGAVMYDTITPASPARRTLSRDEVEALLFLYPHSSRKVSSFDLPVLFYPGDFPGESSSHPLTPELDPGPDCWVSALGTIDFDRDGYCSELLASCREEDGQKTLEGWGLINAETGSVARLASPREIVLEGKITAVCGIDLGRDGICGEAVVLLRDDEQEVLYFYSLEPETEAALTPIASLGVAAPGANNLIGMGSLDADGDGIKDELLLLRATPAGYTLYLHTAPPVGEEIEEPDSGTEINVPGLQEGSRLLGLAVLDADGDGEERDPVFLELTPSGEYWLHAFRLNGSGFGYEISYLTSAPLPEKLLSVLPARMGGLDANRDGYLDELIIFSSKK